MAGLHAMTLTPASLFLLPGPSPPPPPPPLPRPRESPGAACAAAAWRRRARPALSTGGDPASRTETLALQAAAAAAPAHHGPRLLRLQRCAPPALPPVPPAHAQVTSRLPQPAPIQTPCSWRCRPRANGSAHPRRASPCRARTSGRQRPVAASSSDASPTLHPCRRTCDRTRLTRDEVPHCQRTACASWRAWRSVFNSHSC